MNEKYVTNLVKILNSTTNKWGNQACSIICKCPVNASQIHKDFVGKVVLVFHRHALLWCKIQFIKWRQKERTENHQRLVLPCIFLSVYIWWDVFHAATKYAYKTSQFLKGTLKVNTQLSKIERSGLCDNLFTIPGKSRAVVNKKMIKLGNWRSALCPALWVTFWNDVSSSILGARQLRQVINEKWIR